MPNPSDQQNGKEGLRLGGAVSGCAKIGILTFHRCINYGSYWQARCLAEGLQRRGHEVVILDHCSGAIDVAEWRCALRPTAPDPTAPEDIAQYACKTRKFLVEIGRLPLSKPFNLDHPEETEEFDIVVIGSDEVWNLRHPWYAAKPAFFGQGLSARRVVAYAGSFGNYSCWEGLGSLWTDYLRGLDAISVRDENSWWMLNNCLGLEPDLVLDPCLQWPPASDQLQARPYALVYGHHFSDSFAREVRAWADERSIPLLSIGYRNPWADSQWLDAGPGDFIRAMAGASAVATNFFHGCVFSLLNEKPFACEVSAYRSIKIRGLMELLGGEARIVEGGSVAGLLSEPPNAAILSRVAELRRVSDAYLDRALGVGCENQR
jgi:hypothetical protein